MTKGVTVPLTAVGTAAIASWKEVDTGLDTIVQKTGASGDALDEMQGILKNITTSIPTDFATAGAAIGEVNTRFGVAGKELEGLSGQFVKFAKLNNQDVSASVDSVSKMMAGFGLEAEDAGSVLDALNTVGQQTGVDVGQLADQVAANAKQFQEMGLSAEDAAAFLGSASMAGMDTSTAMMGLKTAMKNAAKDGVNLDTALANFQKTMQGNGTETEKLQAAYELFGTRAGGAIANAVENGGLDLANFTTSLGDFEGSVDETFAGTMSPMEEFQTTMNEIKLLGADIANAAAPMLKDAMEGVGKAVSGASEAWNGLSPEMQDMILKIAGVAAVAGPLLVIGGKIIGGISAITGGIGALTGGLGSIGGAASSAGAPVASAGSSIGVMAGQALRMIAAAAALWIAAQAVNTLADSAIRVAAAGAPAIGVLAGMAIGIGALMAVASAVGPGLTAGAVGIAAFGASLLMIGGGVALACAGISAVIASITMLVSVVAANAPQINSIVTNIGTTVSGVIETISGGITQVIDAISGGISGVLDSVAGIFDSIGSAAKDAGTGFQSLASGVKTLAKVGAAKLATTLTATAAGVGAVAKSASEAASGATAFTSISKALKTMGASGTTAAKSMKAIGSGVKSMVTTSAAAMRSATVPNAMKSMMSKTQTTAKAAINKLRNTFSSTKFSFNHHIAVPHFSMSGSFNAKTKSVPSVSTRWYAKAAELGARFTFPQIIGVGDAAQPEILLGENKLKELTGGGGMTVTNYITVDGAENPEDWARRFARTLTMEARMA
jgi:phage-related minor tail protein